MSNKITVSIVIPTHNEDRNIESLLKQLMSQHANHCEIVEIFVVCDGCTDNTVQIVTVLANKYKSIVCIDDGRRVGKAKRLEQIYKIAEGDVIINIDADVRLADKHVIDAAAKCFKDNKISLVGCNDIPDKPETYLERIAEVWIKSWQKLTRPVNGYINPQNCHGCMIACRKDFARKILFPTNVGAEDLFMFYECQRMGRKFKFCKDAIVYFHTPSTFNDYVRQSKRYRESGELLRQYITEDHKYKLNRNDRLLWYVQSSIHEPVFFPLALLLELFVIVYSKISQKSDYKNGMWDAISSSK